MKKLICPKCGSGNVILNVGGNTGKYECKDCGYVGVIIIEKSTEHA